MIFKIRRRSDQSVTASDCGSNGPRFESGHGRCVESLDKALYSHCPKEKPSITLASVSYLPIFVKYIPAKFGDDFTPLFRLWKTITKSLVTLRQLFVAMKMMNKLAKFQKDSQSGKKVISRARLNFGRRPILCTTFKQASDFGGTFDQLSPSILLWKYGSQKMPLYFYYTMVQKSREWPKTQSKGSWYTISKALTVRSISATAEPISHQPI